MHDYTAWKVHEDRLRELTDEADASRLAAIARKGRPRRDLRALLRRWLSLGLARSPERSDPQQGRRRPASILARRAR